MNTQAAPLGNDPLDPNRLALNNGLQQGDFYIGPMVPPVNATPVQSITEYLAKRDDNSDTYVTLKVLQVNRERDGEVSQGKLLLHNEHLVLSLLQDQPGVIHHQGFFKDSGRFILVLDCLIAHSYAKDGAYADFVNLQHYVIKKKRLEEKEALELFYNVLSTVRTLHKKNIVHRDLKLGNLVLNTRTRAVTLTNFALSKHLVRSNDKLTDQRGSLAYVSPDVLSGRPYDGKASDMWALGVLLYTMLYGQFPFYDSNPQELFKKIKAADYIIPDDGVVRMKETTLLIRQLIAKDYRQRLTAAQTLDIVHNRLSRLSTYHVTEHAQVVPDSVVHSKTDDCMVPDQENDLSPPPTAPSIDMNALHLTLSPMLISDLDSHSGHLSLQSPVHTTPGSLSSMTGPFVPYVLTDFPPSQVERPLPLFSTHNPFLGQSSSPFTSPSSLRLSPRSHSSNLPDTHTSSLHSFPPQSLFCHRYPVALNLSSESLVQNDSSRGDRQTDHHVMMTVDESTTPTGTVDSRLSPSQNIMEGLVTIRPSRHSFSSAIDSIPAPIHRHSLSCERLHLVATHNQTQRQRRNSSSGSDRVRRHSSQTVSMNSASSLDALRRRRRSHDVNDERSELLEGLRIASNRRTQSVPVSVPIRIQLSTPTTTGGNP